MRYRVLTIAQTHEIVELLVAGEDFGTDAVALERGDGEQLDVGPLLDIVEVFRERLSECGSSVDTEHFEGQLAAALHPWFSSIPIEVLDDPGFWRYLAVKYFWWFTAHRESDPIARGNFTNLVDATLPAEQIPLRLYLRTRAIDVDGDVQLAGALAHSTDFWRSHINRVRLGSAPVVARVFAEAKLADTKGRLSTNPLRRVARRLNRTWANTNLDIYEREDALHLIQEAIERET
jgi:hypothetical protein